MQSYENKAPYFRWGVAIIYCLLFAIFPTQIAKSSETQPSLRTVMLSQVNSNNFTCDMKGITEVQREACLIGQSTFYTWNELGQPTVCNKIKIVSRTNIYPISRKNSIVIDKALKSQCFKSIFAINTSVTVPALLDYQVYLYLENNLFPELPGSNVEACLDVRAGLCGNHYSTAAAILEFAGIPVRPIEFYYYKNGRRASHIIPEVKISTKWRPIDTTFGAYWADSKSEFTLLTTNQILKMPDRTQKLVRRFSSAGHDVAYRNSDRFEYWLGTSGIVRGGVGEIRFDAKDFEPVSRESFKDRPNFIGDNVENGINSRGLSFKIEKLDERYKSLKIKISAIAVSSRAEARICTDRTCKLLIPSKKYYKFALNGISEKLRIESDADIAYAVLDYLQLELWD